MNRKEFMVKPGSKVSLSDRTANDTPGLKSIEEAAPRLEKNVARIAELQERLYAEGKRSLFIILQGMDTSGKDGATRAVVRDVSPQGVMVTSWKAPSKEELAHDYLWRNHAKVPARGMIGVWNRSHYEEVLVVRVHKWIDMKECQERYRQINDFERILSEEGATIVKLFLHISNKEQKGRLEARLADPKKHWKFNPADLEERKLWPDYVKAYEDVLRECSTNWAPWYVVPADKKWYRNVVVTEIVKETMERMDPRFPKVDWDPKSVKVV
ncbi:MAG TPA: polyphosphate kinase 2 family protein [Thermoplasmata archaeon]|nr:polyphosphate kinase 2 family protein [Thermoplasmata archaeon]